MTAIRTAVFSPSFPLPLLLWGMRKQAWKDEGLKEVVQGSKPALEAAIWKPACCREGQSEVSAKTEKTISQSTEKLLPPPTPQKAKPLKVSKLLNASEHTKIFTMSYLLECRSVGTSCFSNQRGQTQREALLGSVPVQPGQHCPPPFWSLWQQGGCEGKGWAKGKTCQGSFRSCMALTLLKAPNPSPCHLNTQSTCFSGVRHGSWEPTPPHSTDNKACDFWLFRLWIFPSSVPALLPTCTVSS